MEAERVPMDLAAYQRRIRTGPSAGQATELAIELRAALRRG
jgi:hypothetical protein